MSKTAFDTFIDVMKVVSLAGAFGCNVYADMLDNQQQVIVEQVEAGTITEEEGAILYQEYVDKETNQRFAVQFFIPVAITAVLMSDAEKKKSKDGDGYQK